MTAATTAPPAEEAVTYSPCPTCRRPGCRVREGFLQATRKEPAASLGFQGYCPACDCSFAADAPKTRWNSGQEADARPGYYYVTARDERGRTAYLAGPFANDHAAALDAVWAAKRLVEERYPERQTFGVGYGTCRVHDVQKSELPTAIFTYEEVAA